MQMQTNQVSSSCLNCGFEFKEHSKYCPSCGQENISSELPFRVIVREFFENNFSWDSRLGRSIFPFLFKPGELTRKFMEGKRASYVHPLRLYLVTSLFFFTVLTFLPNTSNENKPIVAFNDKETKNGLSIKIDTTVKKSELKLKSETKKKDSEIGRLISLAPKSRIDALKLAGSESEIDSMLRSVDLEPTFWKRKIIGQVIRLVANSENFGSYMISRIPVMMFLLVPFFAVFVRLFYLRWNKLYVDFLMMTIHIHSFLFFSWTIYNVLDSITGIEIFNNLGMVVSFVYVFAAQRKLFPQRIGKTLLKLFSLASIYAIMLIIFLAVNFVIGFFVY